MSDQYLWDRTGEPDPEVQRLEKVLAVYRYSSQEKSQRRALILFAMAASLILVTSGVIWRYRQHNSAWQLDGKPVYVGQTVETNSSHPAKLEAHSFGRVDLDPNSRLAVISSGNGHERLALQQGTMHALIWAPPAKFLVDTPSAKAIDLGCAYTLSVLPDHSGILKVETGWVAFQADSLESFIPAGAVCRTHSNTGPGLPYFEDASQELRNGISAWEGTAKQKGLQDILSHPRKRDALTLWHLAGRTSGTDRELVVQRLASLVPGVDSVGLNAGNSNAINQAWNLLDLGETEWWRLWKHQWH